MQQKSTPHLLAVLPVFIAAKEHIISQWLEYEDLRNVFVFYKIDATEFRSEYAGHVFDYFVGIIREEMKVGECPVMVKLLNYLKNHDVSADELFVFCSNFRRALLEFSYEANINTKELFIESSTIFDLNFSAVLRIYADRVHLKELELAKNVKLLSEYRKAIDESAIVSKTNTQGIIIYANDNFCDLCGYSREELIGKSHNITRHLDMPASFFKKLWETIKVKKVFKGTIKNRRKDGEYYYVDTAIMPIIDPVKEVTEYMSIGYDVTKLIDATEQAIDAGEAKDYFLSNMSHEIRTPLNAILGFVTLLLDEDNAPKHRKYLDIIHKSGQNLLNIINDILDFSKLRSGEFTVDARVFDPHEELPQALELFASGANEKAITLFSFMDPAIPHGLVADPLRIKQIISNLLSNAIKFTPYDGRIDVEVNYEEGMLKIKVTDSGVGISDEDQTKIFQAFSQAHHGVLRASGGTGLGLSICQQLAEHMHGSIELTSRLGKGSSFELILPVTTAETSSGPFQFDPGQFKEVRLGLLQCCDKESEKIESLKRHWQAFGLEVVRVDQLSDDQYDLLFFVDSDVDEEMRLRIIAQSLPSIAIMEYLDDRYDMVENVVPLYFPIYCVKLYGTFAKALKLTPKPDNKRRDYQIGHRRFDAHVLVAEDNAANQELIKIILERYGIRHTVVPNGIEVLNKFHSGSYDMILMDEQMPLMNGLDAMHKIVEFEYFQGLEHTPVVALTANVIKGARERGLSAGYDAFLGKPINLKEIENVFEHFLKEEAKVPVKYECIGGISICGVNVEKLKEELMLDSEQIATLLKIFLKKMAQILPELAAAIDKGDYKEIARLGHAIKGSSANFRIEKIQSLARTMEDAAVEKKRGYDFDEACNKLKIEIKKIVIEDQPSM